MKLIRHCIICFILVSNGLPHMASAQVKLNDLDPFDFYVGGKILKARQTSAWDTSQGAEFRFMLWDLSGISLADEVGFFASVGLETWGAAGGPHTIVSRDEDENLTSTVTTFYTGDATMIPIGISGVFHQELYEKAKGIIEVGIRHVMVNSDVEARTERTAYTRGGPETFSSSGKVDVDSAWIALLGLHVHFPVYRQLEGFAGIGWQVDLFRGDRSVPGLPTTSNRLQGTFLQAGFTF